MTSSSNTFPKFNSFGNGFAQDGDKAHASVYKVNSLGQLNLITFECLQLIFVFSSKLEIANLQLSHELYKLS
jgi:hypothetical protein